MEVLQVKFTRELSAALKLKGDPVLAMVEIDNETSRLQPWSSRSLDKAILGDYRAEWLRQWGEFRKSATEVPLEGDEYISFMADRDRAYLRRMRDAIRDRYGPAGAIAGTRWSWRHAEPRNPRRPGLPGQPLYIDHYNFPHTAWDSATGAFVTLPPWARGCPAS
jgi:hypothetical protein